jgi:hypothetical protein
MSISSIMACRICFESEGLLLSPCRCDGSIKYVHSNCLVRWDHMRPDESQGTCELCKEAYAMAYNDPLETDLLAPNPRSFLLINPSWHIASSCICTILLNRIISLPNPTLYLYIHLTYQSLYLLFMSLYIHYTVRNLTVYLAYWTNYYARFILSGHFLLLVITIALYTEKYYNSLILLGVLNQCYLCVYPLVHTSILTRMNKGRILLVRNRGS